MIFIFYFQQQDLASYYPNCLSNKFHSDCPHKLQVTIKGEGSFLWVDRIVVNVLKFNTN
jgi:hypothetical protein